MQLLEMTMPADFETLRQQKGASLIFTTLEILEDIERASDSILIRCTRAASLSKLRALFTRRLCKRLVQASRWKSSSCA